MSASTSPIFVLLCLLQMLCFANGSNVWRLGIVGQLQDAKAIIDLALKHIHEEEVLGNDTVQYSYIATQEVSPAVLACLDFAAYHNSSAKPVHAVIGPLLAKQATGMQTILREFSIPQLSWGASAAELSDKTQYPSFSRLLPSDSKQGVAIAHIIRHFGWNQAAILYTNDALGPSFTQNFAQACDELNIRILSAQSFEPGQTAPTASMRESLRLVKRSGARIIVLASSIVDTKIIMRMAVEEMQMGTADYVWLGIHANMPYYVFPLGALGTMPFVNTSAPAWVKVRQELFSKPPYQGQSPAKFGRLLSISYDAVWHIAYSIKALKQLRLDCANMPAQFSDGGTASDCALVGTDKGERQLLTRIIRRLKWNGISGPIELDANGDRVMAYSIFNQWANASQPNPGPIITQTQTTASFREVGVIDPNFAIRFTRPIVWGSHLDEVPLDHELIGMRVGETAQITFVPTIIVLAVSTAVIGSWTSLILVDQAVSNHQHGKTITMLGWLALSSAALAISDWTTMIIGLSAIDVPRALNFAVWFSTLETFVSLAIVLPVTAVSFAVAIAGVLRRGTSRSAIAPAMHQAARAPEVSQFSLSPSGSQLGVDVISIHESKPGGATPTVVNNLTPTVQHKTLQQSGNSQFSQKGALSFIRKLGLTWHVPLAALLLVTGFMATQNVVLPGLDSNCELTYADTELSVGLVVGFVLATIAIWMFFFFRKTVLRFVGAFVMSGAICTTHFLSLSGMQARYTGIQPDATLGAETIRLVGSIVMAGTAFLFIGLNVTRLRLSRDSLDAYLLRTQKRVRHLEDVIRHRDADASELRGMLELIQITRPRFRAKHFALSSLLERAQAWRNLGIMAPSVPEIGDEKRQPENVIEKPSAMLTDLLKNPACVELFKDFLAGSDGAILLNFYLDVQSFKKLPSDERQTAASEILATYFTGGDTLQVGAQLVESTVRDASKPKVTPTAFQGAEVHALEQLARLHYQRFIPTEAFGICVGLLKAAEVFASARKALHLDGPPSATPPAPATPESAADHSQVISPMHVRPRRRQNGENAMPGGIEYSLSGSGGLGAGPAIVFGRPKSPTPLAGNSPAMLPVVGPNHTVSSPFELA